MEKFLKFYFFLSLAIVLFFLGWAFGEFSNVYSLFFKQIIEYTTLLIITFFFILLAIFIFKKKTLNENNFLIFTCLTFFYINFLPFGYFFNQSNFFNINNTIRLSYKDVLVKSHENNFLRKIFVIKWSLQKKNIDKELSYIKDEFNVSDYEKKVCLPENKLSLKLHNTVDNNLLIGAGVSVPMIIAKNVNGKTERTCFYGTEKMMPFYVKENVILTWKDDYASKKEYSIHRYNYSKHDNILTEVWSKKNTRTLFHHWGDVFNKKIYIPVTETKELNKEIQKEYSCRKEIFHETINVYNFENGDLIQNIDVVEDFFSKLINWSNFKCEKDIFHLNDVRIIKEKQLAEQFPKGQVGDMLISMRNINTIALVDKDSHKIKWFVQNLFLHQHSPRLTNRGSVLVFDNKGGKTSEFGRSRIVEINIKTKKIMNFFESKDKNFFETSGGGRIQLINGSIFLLESNPGRIYKLICNKGVISPDCNLKKVFTFMDQNRYNFDDDDSKYYRTSIGISLGFGDFFN